MSEWTRPLDVPFPSVWRTFEGKKLINGARRKYWVQDLTDEYKDEALNLMATEFTRDEALCKYSNLKDDPVGLEEIKYIWSKKSEHKLVLLCLTDGVNGKPEIAAVNMTYWSSVEPFDESSKIKSAAMNKIMRTVHYIYDKVDVVKVHGIDQHLTALGLLVLPKFRGDGVGVEVLKSRRELCKAVGIAASLTLFTSNTSQAVARRAGFQDIVEVTYEQLEKANPEFVFPGIREVSNSQRYMYLKYE